MTEKKMMYDEWCEGLVAALNEPFPDEYHSTKRRGGTLLTFVPWYRYVERLNELVGSGWSIERPDIRDYGGRLVVGVRLTILGVTRQNFGDEIEEKDTFGTPITNAYAQAFKRSCAMFGLGLYLYDDTRPKW